MPERLVDELVRQELLPADLGRRALEQQVLHGGALDSAILETSAIDEDALLEAIVRAYGGTAATREDRTAPVDESALRCLPEQWAQKHALAPLEWNRQKSSLRVLTPAPVDARLIERLGELLELRIVPSIDLEFRVYERLAVLYGTRPPERFVALIEQARGPASSVPWATNKANGSWHRPSDRGRLTFGEAVNMLREATEREDIVKTALLYTIRDLQFAAMLIVPAATARPFAGTPERMALAAAIIGGLSVIGGLQASLLWDLPSGPAIVVAALTLFIGASAWRSATRR